MTYFTNLRRQKAFDYPDSPIVRDNGFGYSIYKTSNEPVVVHSFKPALRKQRNSEFQASLDYPESFRIARATQSISVSGMGGGGVQDGTGRDGTDLSALSEKYKERKMLLLLGCS